ncbi:MAG TPA: efflux RND transporter permease subunit [Bacteroidales bacterium]|nr:efflux RND transporter permease subunit [Bacteroidales bacterium]HRX96979.1 efflux RND transporter permease subunit [Bacteroidales bacterium]
MKKAISLFIRFPFYANIILFIILVVGAFSFVNMNRSFFPELREKFINISVFYPGASPKEMEEGITIRIEEALRGIAGIKEVNSTASENFTSVKVEVTGEYDIDETLMEVKNAVDGITSFPVDAEKPIVNKQRSTTFAVFMGLSGDADMLTLKQYANEIEFDLYNSGLMSQITIGGFPDLEISVEIPEDNLRRYNLTFDEVSRAIAANNQDISGGQIRSEKEEVMIRSRYRTVEPAEIENIIIRGNPDGTYLRIADVGTVEMKFADRASTSLMNGQPSASIQVSKLPDEDLTAISDYVNKYAKEWNQTHSDAQLHVTYDFLKLLGARLSLLYKNGGLGLLLIFITLGLFLSLRLSIWVALGIPAAFGAMFILGMFYGVTVNMISLFGMILVIGILVDDGIVIAENIYTHFEKGKSPRKAALDGTMEVLPAVLTSVTTTVVVFSALFFIRGRMEFMYEMAFVVVFSLLFSLLEAFFVLPAHLGSHKVLRKNVRQNTGKRIRDFLDKLLDFMRLKVYGKSLQFVIKWRYVFLFLPVFLFIITFGLLKGGLIKATFFPAIPFDQFNVDIAYKPGSGEAQTLKTLQRIDDIIWEVNDELKEELNDSVDFVNYSFLSTGSAFQGTENGSHAGNIFVLLRDLEESGTSSYEIVTRVQKKVGEIPEAEKLTIQGRATFGTPISVSLLGKDEEILNHAKQDLIQSLKQIEDLNNIADVNPSGMREIRLKLKPLAYFLGFSQASLTSQVRQGFFGGQAQRLQHGKDELRVWVRYPKTDRINIGQLENMRIKTMAGEYPLSELASYTIDRGPVSIKHFNGAREIRVDADVVSYDTPVVPIQEKIENEIVPELLARYPGVNVAYLGQKKDSDETMAQIKKFFVPAFLLMFLIVIIHFKSLAQGLIIIAMIPLAWLGAFWGHGVEGVPVSLLSVWGMLALSGVIINDAVVFLSKYNALLVEGKKVKEAVFETGIARFRAIVLTTITTSVGLYPIIFERSFQAQFLVPMAVALAYGVLVGTGFILIFFPVIILTLNDLKRLYLWIRNLIHLWVLRGDPELEVTSEIAEELSAIPSPESVEIAIIHSKRTIE